MHSLVNHQRADDDLFALKNTGSDLLVLLVEIGNKAGSIMSSITLCCKNKPKKLSLGTVLTSDK
jgi:hypothetical protein